MSKNVITSGFLPRVEKNRVLDNVDNTTKLLRDETIPVYDATLRNNLFTRKHSFKNPWVQRRAKAYDTALSRYLKGNIIEGTSTLLKGALKRLEWIRTQFDGSGDFLRDNLTFKNVAMIQLYDATCFFIDYARKLLLVVYSYESPAYMSGEDASLPYSKAEMLEIEEQFDMFLKISIVFAKNGENAPKLIESIPEVQFNPNDLESAKSALGLNKLDPLQMGFSPSTKNPIWFIATAIDEWQHARYEAAKEERKALNLRLIQMRLEQQAQKDAANDRLIEYSENRLRKLNMKIGEMEKRYA